MKITKSRLKELVKETMIEENEYKDFFKQALEKAGKSIPDMSDEEKKSFFNKVDSAWKAKGEKNEALTGDQDELDVDGDGDIEADDLADLRKGKKVNESFTADPRKVYGGTAGKEGMVLVSKKGLSKILDLSKKNPSNVFVIRDDNYTNFGPYYVKNGKVAKRTVANPNYDFQNNQVRSLKVPSDVILKFNIVENVNESINEESEYKTFFKKALEKTGKDKITSMSDEEKKAFFNKIDASWKAKGEKKEVNEAFDTKKVDAKKVASKMRKIQTMKAFADDVEKMGKLSQSDLSDMLPDYVAGGDIFKVFK
jgi:hypothetical protein